MVYLGVSKTFIFTDLCFKVYLLYIYKNYLWFHYLILFPTSFPTSSKWWPFLKFKRQQIFSTSQDTSLSQLQLCCGQDNLNCPPVNPVSFSKFFRIVPSALTMIGITVMYYNLFCSLAWARHLSNFSLSFHSVISWNGEVHVWALSFFLINPNMFWSSG